MTLKRTNSHDADFGKLANELEAYLRVIDGDAGELYAVMNIINTLDFVIVAYINNQPVACGGFRGCDNETTELKRMYVLQANQRKGIARILLHELERWCVELGFVNCVLETGKNQPDAVAFYKNNGYIEIPNFGRYINSKNSICFKKKLK